LPAAGFLAGCAASASTPRTYCASNRRRVVTPQPMATHHSHARGRMGVEQRQHQSLAVVQSQLPGCCC
jgi:hypothetical protein